MHPLKKNPHTKMSAFSGASQCRISQETMVTMFSHPSSLTRLCSKRCNVIPNMINITILRKGKTMILKKSKEKRKQFQSTRSWTLRSVKERKKPFSILIHLERPLLSCSCSPLFSWSHPFIFKVKPCVHEFSFNLLAHAAYLTHLLAIHHSTSSNNILCSDIN